MTEKYFCRRRRDGCTSVGGEGEIRASLRFRRRRMCYLWRERTSARRFSAAAACDGTDRDRRLFRRIFFLKIFFFRDFGRYLPLICAPFLERNSIEIL